MNGSTPEDDTPLESLRGDDLVQVLDRMLRPPLVVAAEHLRERYPLWRINFWSGQVGSRTQFRGHDWGIEGCTDLDTVALEVSVCHLMTEPRFMADVCWRGDSAGGTEASLPYEWTSSDEWPLVTSDGIAELRSSIPGLLEALEAAFRRTPQQ